MLMFSPRNEVISNPCRWHTFLHESGHFLARFCMSAKRQKVAAMMPTDCAGQRRRRLIAPWFGTDGSTYLNRVI
jgi:hypothetical protein